jgi:hypothetical protein
MTDLSASSLSISTNPLHPTIDIHYLIQSQADFPIFLIENSNFLGKKSSASILIPEKNQVVFSPPPQNGGALFTTEGTAYLASLLNPRGVVL